MPTLSIIRQIESLGYTVQAVRTDGGRLLAVQRAEPHEKHTVALADASDLEAAYLAACQLAQAVGIELEDG